MSKLNILRNTGILLGAMSLLYTGMTYAQEEMGTESIGKVEFQKNCGSCHGVGGKGDGPMVEFLTQKPTDLTSISKRNNGVYPQKRVYNWIRDPEGIRAHGTVRKSLRPTVRITQAQVAQCSNVSLSWYSI